MKIEWVEDPKAQKSPGCPFSLLRGPLEGVYAMGEPGAIQTVFALPKIPLLDKASYSVLMRLDRATKKG
jgi:hypothetical protein